MGSDGRCPGCGGELPAEAACVTCFARQFARPAAPGLPRFPDLEVLGRVGDGGFGTVYEAFDPRKNRRVAVKLLHSEWAADPIHRDRFRREFETVVQFRHKGIVPVYEFVEDADRAWFVMELLDGPSLTELFRNPLPPADVVLLLGTVARAVAYAHDRNVCHLDLSPSNILLGADGQPVVVDFGLALGLRERLPLIRSAVRGFTPGYTAPEFLGTPEPNARPNLADVFSLGAVLYKGLTGNLPSTGDPAALTFPPSVPRDLRAVCAKCLDPDPERRYQRVAEIAADLEAFAAGFPVAARPLHWPVRVVRAVLRRPVLSTALLLLVALLAGLTGGIISERQLRAEQRARAEQEDRDRATAAAARAESERVARLADAADAAFHTGRWEMAAEQYREAIARGHPESARLTVRRLRALFVANRVAEAEAALGALPDDPGLDALRGQVLLLRAEVAFLDAGRAEEARALLRQALAAPGLSGAEVAYAHGLLADSVLDMLGRFEEAVDRDPNYYPGQTALTVGLLVTGRYADARIRIRFVRGLFPDDRFPEFAEGLVDLYSGAVSAGLKRLEQVAAQMGGPRGEWVRSHARKLANQLTAVGELNARSGMASGVMLTDKTLKEREVNGAELRQMFSPDGFPLVVPSPVVSRLFDPGVAYFDAARILVTERDPAKAAAVAETALARDPDASLAAFACQLRFLTAAQLYSAPKRDTKRLEAEMRRAVALGERAITDPCRYAGSSFRYEGRVFSVLALGCLAQPNEFPDAAREFRPRLRAALPQLVAEGANFPQMRREAVAALVNTGLLDPTEWRAVLSDWSAADSADPQPLELLAAMELNAGNGAAARDVAARATAAFPNDTGLKSRLEVLFPPVPSIPAAAP